VSGGRAPRRASRTGYRPRRPDTGPGIIETSLVIGLAGLLAVAILVFFGGGVWSALNGWLFSPPAEAEAGTENSV